MKQSKPNRMRWYCLGLTALLSIAFLVAATGTTLARYRAQREEEIQISVRQPEQIHLGTVNILTDEEPATGEDAPEVTEQFVATTDLTWETQEGVAQLKFAVANGTTQTDYSARTQQFQLRMIGTLGIWTESQIPILKLTLFPEEGGEQEVTFTATATPIPAGAALHRVYGDGWIYTFLDENGEEVCWQLPGGSLSYLSMTVTAEGELPQTLSLLQPQVIAETVRE